MKTLISIFLIAFSISLKAQIAKIDTLMFNGDINQRINLIILGDGYLETELPNFLIDAQTFSELMFEQTPFIEYKNYFNIFAISVASNETGAASDPNNLIDNYYGSSFWVGGIERLLVPLKSSNALQILANYFPNYDQVIMLVNTTKYGGSGGWLATSSVHQTAGEIVLHEIGHSFAGLADEYWAGDHYANEKPNMTRETNPDVVKWKNWYGEYEVGIYQHCCTPISYQWYRPHNNCKMQSLGFPFCPVCLETTISIIHRLTSPIDAYSPLEQNIKPEEFPISFELDLLKPEPNTLKVDWVLNSNQYEFNTDFINIESISLKEGNNTLVVYVQDTTEYIRIDNYGTINFQSVTWNIDYDLTDIKDITSGELNIIMHLYPNPTKENINIKFENLLNNNFSIKIHNLLGETLKEYNNLSLNPIQIDLSEFESNLLFISIYENGYQVATRKIIKE